MHPCISYISNLSRINPASLIFQRLFLLCLKLPCIIEAKMMIITIGPITCMMTGVASRKYCLIEFMMEAKNISIFYASLSRSVFPVNVKKTSSRVGVSLWMDLIPYSPATRIISSRLLTSLCDSSVIIFSCMVNLLYRVFPLIEGSVRGGRFSLSALRNGFENTI